MENKQIDIKTESSEKLGLMLGEIAMAMNQQYQNYQAIANELRGRITQTTNNVQPQENNNATSQ